MISLSTFDFIAISIFACSWILFIVITELAPFRERGISWLMANERRRWMLVMLDRQLRIVDISIINGLQQGAAFYASFCILAIGGCFAILGATDNVLQVLGDLPINIETNRASWELKILGFVSIYAYAFFKFGWSYRLFMYCSILVGGVASVENIKTRAEKEQARCQTVKATDINTAAAKHFNSGQRGVYFSMGYLGWLVSPQLLIAGSLLTLLVLLRRQFFSKSREIVAGMGDDKSYNAKS